MMTILDAKQSDKALEKKVDELKKFIEEHGFKIVDEDVWGTRKLAYKMNGHKDGYYIIFNFEGEPAGIADLNKDLAIMVGLVRYLLIKVADDYVLMRYDKDANLAPATTGKQKLSKHAEELSKKVASSSKKEEKVEEKEEKKEKEEAKEENKEELDEKLQAIVDDADIDL